ncbi:MAG TPA: PfkB family carbohydrate kinase, partial [Thermomicrobiales bacterium]|nr:PfkB family carbohydrate kinase [Thermomicrobiales bacterium]
MGGEPTAVDVVRGFAGLRALVIGDAMLDSYLEGVATRLCKEGPVPVVRRGSVERAPGGAANAAANLVSLGADVRLVGLVGPDDAGAALRAALRERGVDDRWLVEDPAIATIHKQRIVAIDQYVVRFDVGDTLDVSPEARSRVLAAVEDGFAACDLVDASDYSYGVLSDDIIDRLRTLREKLPRVLAVDAKDIGRFASARATVVTPNLNEARLAIDPGAHLDPAPTAAEGEAIARRLHAKLDADNVVVTMAGDGVVLIESDGRATHLPTFPV